MTTILVTARQAHQPYDEHETDIAHDLANGSVIADFISELQVQAYRVLWIGDAGEVLATSASFEASDDMDAQQQSISMANGDHVELWQGLRLVARINAKAMPNLGR